MGIFNNEKINFTIIEETKENKKLFEGYPKKLYNFVIPRKIKVFDVLEKEHYKNEEKYGFGFSSESFPRNYIIPIDKKEEHIERYKNWFLKGLRHEASLHIFENGFFEYMYNNGYITDEEIIENLKIPDILYRDLIPNEEKEVLIKKEDLILKEDDMGTVEKFGYFGKSKYEVKGIKKGADLTKLIKYFKKEY